MTDRYRQTVTPTVNAKRLLALAQWAAAQDALRKLGLPSQWNQGLWLADEASCGSACCIAGKVALEDGMVPDFSASMFTSVVHPKNKPDEEVPVSEYAREALGLTYAEADNLFSGSNSLDDVLRIIATLIGSEYDPDPDEEG